MFLGGIADTHDVRGKRRHSNPGCARHDFDPLRRRFNDGNVSEVLPSRGREGYVGN